MPGPWRERSTRGYRHGLRVRIGSATGGRGVLLRCDKRDGTGQYWRVRLQDGRWMFPEAIIVDGPGDFLMDACQECGLPFITRGPDTTYICDRCAAELFGQASGAFPNKPDDVDEPRQRRRR